MIKASAALALAAVPLAGCATLFGSGQARSGRAVWAYFNNDPEAHAIHDAQTLRGMVGQALR